MDLTRKRIDEAADRGFPTGPVQVMGIAVYVALGLAGLWLFVVVAFGWTS